MNKSRLLQQLNWQDCFSEFTALSTPESWTWHYDHDFLEAIYTRHKNTRLAVEVGSWLGGSAIKASTFLTTQLQLRDFCLICVDTWLGNLEHWLRPETQDSLHLEQGYPRLYQHFLSNVALSGMSDYILPFPQTSSIAAKFLRYHKLRADWIYLDASHDTLEVFFDLNAYWPSVKAGGTLMGDDWNWPTVRQAVIDFANDYSLEIEHSYYSWAMHKPR